MTIYLETERVKLRDWEDSDLEDFARINRDPLIMEYYPTRLDDKASAALVKHFQEHIDKKGFGFFALESKEDGRFMGFSGLAEVPKSLPCAPAVELAWRLDYDYWGKAYASEIARGLIAYGFETLQLEEIVAYCVTEHHRAKHLLEKLGFTSTGKDDFKYAPNRNKKAKETYNLYRLQAA